MKPLKTVGLLGLTLALGGVANAAPDISKIGSLVRTNVQGDYRYADRTQFNHNGTRGYISSFASMLSSDGSYRSILKNAIVQWEDDPLSQEKRFTSDMAGGLAYFTVVNLALAKGENYRFQYLPNLVSQYRKALSSRVVASMSNNGRQDMYDYLMAQAVYMQTRAASNPGMTAEEAKRMKEMASGAIRSAFGVSASGLSISEYGLVW